MGVCNSVCELVSTINGEDDANSMFYAEEFNEMFTTLGIDKDPLSPPTGSAGFAIYPVVDYEIGSVGIGLLGLVDVRRLNCLRLTFLTILNNS